MIVQTITETQFVESFRIMNRMDNFSYDALKALHNYLEDLSEDIGEPIELDVIALCCDFYEMSWDDVASEYSLVSNDELQACDDVEEQIELLKEALEEETNVVWYDDEKVLFQVF